MKNAIEVTNVSKKFKSLQALDQINLTIAQNDFVALVGPNGAGKTTLIGVLSSLVNKDQGDVKIFGYDHVKQAGLAKQKLGVVPQEFNFSIFETVEQILLNQAGYFGVVGKEARKRLQRNLELVKLWEKRKSSSRHLSGGMKRRLLIARALMHDPDILILDEPTAGVDIEIRRSLWALFSQLHAAGMTMVLTSHYLEEAEQLASKIALINHGQITAYLSMREFLAQSNETRFLIELDQPEICKKQLPAEYQVVGCDAHGLEIILPRGQYLNQLFEFLTAHAINVTSVRPKYNRLEEILLNLSPEETADA